MASIKGRYEWDDDDLTPGRKREGGLHQNLFDSDGKLKGNARFVPDDTEPYAVTETVFVPVEQRRRTREEEELERAIAALVAHLIDRGIAAARPYVEQWWRGTVRPAIDTRRAQMFERRSRRKSQKEATVLEPSQELTDASGAERLDMSRAEAGARYLAALAARAYSDEQLRLVSRANIVDGQGLAELKESLSMLPTDDVRTLLEAMVTDPSLLAEDSLARLASTLGRRGGLSSNESRPLS